MASDSSARTARTARSRTRPDEHSGAARAHRGLALLFLAVAALVQFLLAGLIAFGHGGVDAHASVGSALTVVALLLVILAAVGRRAALPASALLLGLMIVQNVLGLAGDDVSILAALHPLNGLLILGTAMLAAAARPVQLGHGHGGGGARSRRAA